MANTKFLLLFLLDIVGAGVPGYLPMPTVLGALGTVALIIVLICLICSKDLRSCCSQLFLLCFGAIVCLPCLPCWILCCIFSNYRCELCSEKVRTFNSKHREECVEENQEDYIAIPDSTLYECKKCDNILKVWPEKLERSHCFKCNLELLNNGTNLHYCFLCEYAVCDAHHQGQGMSIVDREKKTIEPKDIQIGVELLSDPSADPPAYNRLTSVVVETRVNIKNAGRKVINLQRMMSKESPPPPSYEDAMS